MSKKDSEVTIESLKEEMQVLLRNMENLRKDVYKRQVGDKVRHIIDEVVRRDEVEVLHAAAEPSCQFLPVSYTHLSISFTPCSHMAVFPLLL